MNKALLYESIMRSVAKQVKNALNEYRTALPEHNIDMADLKEFLKMTIQEWIYKKFTSIPDLINKFRSFTYEPYGKLHLYIGSVYPDQPIKLTVGAYANYYNVRADLQKIQEYIKKHREFKIISSKIQTLQQIQVEYNFKKDDDLQLALTDAKRKFNMEVDATNTDKYAPTTRDWMKMVDYKNKHSNPERVANSCKDNNKIVARYIIANTLGWKEAVKAFKDRIYELNILNDVQLEAYRRKYATYNIPEDIKELINDLQEYDEKGGLNEVENSEIFPENLKKYMHQNNNINSYKIELIDPVPVKEHRTQRYRIATHQYTYHSYTISQGTIDQAKVTFTLFDNSEVELYYVYRKKNGNYVGRFYKSKIVSYDWDDYKHLFNATSAVHTLKFCFGEED